MDDPLAHLTQLGTAYREHALAEPAYCRVMFEQAVPEYRPSAEALAVAETAFDASAAAVAACIDAGVFRPGDAQEISKIFWAASHGAVSLEFAGHFTGDTAARRYAALMTAVGRAFGADPESIQVSVPEPGPDPAPESSLSSSPFPFPFPFPSPFPFPFPSPFPSRSRPRPVPVPVPVPLRLRARRAAVMTVNRYLSGNFAPVAEEVTAYGLPVRTHP
ncbi:TetR-like C-terminal domain-containing protein [Streptomyces sp. x-80]|uniref:TetR-like C-terminal domain-containing protein n=1 Tax=Streptomyces sp. x-80 TaxID=2789282 RepID=UPI003980EF2A